MPGLIAHYACATAVSRRLGGVAGGCVSRRRNFYNVGSQGPDVFFYDFFGLLRREKRGLGSEMHNGGFARFCLSVGDGLRDGGLDSDVKEEAFAWFCGYITHYALDCAAHPYIYYKSGHGGRLLNRVRISAKHRRLETNIDTAFLKRASGRKPSEKKLWRVIHVKKRDSLVASRFLTECLNDAYDKSFDSRAFQRAFSRMSLVTRVLQSKRGRRKKLLELVEGAVIGANVLSSLIHDDSTVYDGKDYMNMKGKSWHLPWDKSEKRRDTFMDMFNEAVADAVNMIAAFEGYVGGTVSEEQLVAVTGDRSFASGIDASERVSFSFREQKTAF